jgi:hypothetical protein
VDKTESAKVMPPPVLEKPMPAPIMPEPPAVTPEPAPAPTPAPEPERTLPKTAGELPLLGALGLFALFIRQLVRRFSIYKA